MGISKPCNVKACNSDKKKNKNIFFECKNLLGEFDLFNGNEIIHTIVEVNMRNVEFYRKQKSQRNIAVENKTPFLIMTNSDMINFSQNKKHKNCMMMKNVKILGILNPHKKKSTKIKLCKNDMGSHNFSKKKFLCRVDKKI